MKNFDKQYIEKIRRKVYWTKVCLNAGVSYSGTAIEEIIEPEYYENYGYRKGTFSKIASGVSSPRPKTLDKVEGKFKGTKQVFNLLFWEALTLGTEGAVKVDFYKKLPLKLQHYLIDGNTGELKNIGDRQISAIHKDGSWDALSCLIARIQTIGKTRISNTLERRTLSLLMIYMKLPYFQNHAFDIYRFVSNKLRPPENLAPEFNLMVTFKDRSETYINNWIEGNNLVSQKTERFGLINSWYEDVKLHYWLFELGWDETVQEVLKISDGEYLDSYPYLLKLINKINIGRKKNDLINTKKIHFMYQLKTKITD